MFCNYYGVIFTPSVEQQTVKMELMLE